MLVVVSPAKKMDMSPVEGLAVSQPSFDADTAELAKVAQGLDVAALQKLMHISAPLAQLNAERFRDFGTMEKKARE